MKVYYNISTMLSYELCKKLKEAGFPFQKVEDCKPTNGERIIIKHPCIAFEDGEFYWQPTLSELIEACGEHIVLHGPGTVEVSEWYFVPSEINWTAFKQYFRKTDNVSIHQIDAKGLTPEEALANLWLELNKK